METTPTASAAGAHNALVVSIEEAARRLSLSRMGVYRLLDSGQLASIKVGRRRLVPVAALEQLVVDLQNEQSA